MYDIHIALGSQNESCIRVVDLLFVLAGEQKIHERPDIIMEGVP